MSQPYLCTRQKPQGRVISYHSHPTPQLHLSITVAETVHATIRIAIRRTKYPLPHSTTVHQPVSRSSQPHNIHTVQNPPSLVHSASRHTCPRGVALLFLRAHTEHAAQQGVSMVIRTLSVVPSITASMNQATPSGLGWSG